MITFEEIQKLSSAQVVALTVYGESRGEPPEGIIAVINVIKNRFLSTERFSSFKTYQSVCLSPKQFSCWNEGDPNLTELLEIATQLNSNVYLKDNKLWMEISYLVSGVINDFILDNTYSALFYMTSALAKDRDQSKWKKKTVKGAQIFYSL